jgi:hypothetical protein
MPGPADTQALQATPGSPDVLDSADTQGLQGVLESWERVGSRDQVTADLRGAVLPEHGCRCGQVLAFLTADLEVCNIAHLIVPDLGIIDVAGIAITTGGAAAGTAAHTDMAIRDTVITLHILM